MKETSLFLLRACSCREHRMITNNHVYCILRRWMKGTAHHNVWQNRGNIIAISDIAVALSLSTIQPQHVANSTNDLIKQAQISNQTGFFCKNSTL